LTSPHHHLGIVGVAIGGHRQRDGRFHIIPRNTGQAILKTHDILHINASGKPQDVYTISVFVCGSCSDINVVVFTPR
jgi:hypothetical protein